ncbi:hypothetical protein WOSG25_170170 [Weissella oryzae SG25]|uniref:Uncharacterized protein n=1 Tax=Weissella oryzae (strain DSM 25784 / JCM 18191 / LMG 30913 / SG25) TaxID=1329250 RepID=A0A069CWL7_WEIOS|nr:hypothetical protein [Weissella oryzae]GAK31834.1 hypothetical protein WOSG25_170170 [Weissella oryzae SG25]
MYLLGVIIAAFGGIFTAIYLFSFLYNKVKTGHFIASGNIQGHFIGISMILLLCLGLFISFTHPTNTNQRVNANSMSSEKETLKSYAKTFGLKSVDELQQKSNVYSSSQITEGTLYSWNSGKGILMRLDTNSDGMTTVYKLDNDNNKIVLWTGKTIFQRTKVNRYYLN